MKPQETRLTGRTLYLLRKRKHWRQRAATALLEFATWPTGKPGRETIEAEAEKAQRKVSQWYRFGRDAAAFRAMRARAIAAFRNQFNRT